MGTGLGAQVGLGKDDDIQRLCEPVEQLRLVQAGLDVSLHPVVSFDVPLVWGRNHILPCWRWGPRPAQGDRRKGSTERHRIAAGKSEADSSVGHLQSVVVAEVPV